MTKATEKPQSAKPKKPAALTVKLVELSKLKPDPKNVRKRDDAAVEAIAKSMGRFGQQKPIVVKADGTIIAGNGTYEAAKSLGWPTIAVLYTKLEGDEATAFAIADNRTADLAFWDERGLLEQIAMLDDPDLVGFTAFSDKDLELLAQGLAPDIDTDDDDDKANAEPPDNSQEPDDLSYQIIATCSGEKDQAKLYEELTSRGYECRILML